MFIIAQDPPINLFDAVMAHRSMNMVAYLHKTRTGWELTICAGPCNGEAFQRGEKLPVAGKREANKVCKERGITPWNF
jgi:hypothetical protein